MLGKLQQEGIEDREFLSTAEHRGISFLAMILNGFSYYHLLTFKPVFCNLFSPTAHPNLPKTHDGIPQNFASQKGDTKLYIATNMYLHINPCPMAYGNKT
jgi:hypothetical protein